MLFLLSALPAGPRCIPPELTRDSGQPFPQSLCHCCRCKHTGASQPRSVSPSHLCGAPGNVGSLSWRQWDCRRDNTGIIPCNSTNIFNNMMPLPQVQICQSVQTSNTKVKFLNGGFAYNFWLTLSHFAWETLQCREMCSQEVRFRLLLATCFHMLHHSSMSAQSSGE